MLMLFTYCTFSVPPAHRVPISAGERAVALAGRGVVRATRALERLRATLQAGLPGEATVKEGI